MITAQDIREKTFEKSTFGGYAMGEVDDFLDELANDLAVTQKESAMLKGKMKVLVEKIEEYRSSEDAMKMALVSAQKIAKEIESGSQSKADAVLDGARKEAADIVAAAQAEADRISGGIKARADAEEARYQQTRAAAQDYIQKLRMLAEKELSFLNAIKDADLAGGAIVTPAPAEKKAIPETTPVAAEPAAEYFKSFESAVYQTSAEPEEDEELAEEEGAEDPMFRF